MKALLNLKTGIKASNLLQKEALLVVKGGTANPMKICGQGKP